MLLAPYVCFHILVNVWVLLTEWPPIGKMVAHAAYNIFSSYLIANLVFFPNSVFGVGIS